MHSGDDAVAFTLPGQPWGSAYEVVVDTTNPGGEPAADAVVTGGVALPFAARTSMLLRVRR